MNRHFAPRRAALLPAMLLALSPGSPARAAPPTPEQVVDSFHFALLGAMHAGGACADRAKPLRTIIAADFDLPAISRQVLRRHWDKLDDAQHAKFTTSLTTLVVNTYASQFQAYNGETFEEVATTEFGASTKQVRTRMKRPDGAPVTFDYLMRDAGQGWRIVNIVADGVSDLAVRGAQYDQIMKTEGFDKLVERLDRQAGGC